MSLTYVKAFLFHYSHPKENSLFHSMSSKGQTESLKKIDMGDLNFTLGSNKASVFNL